MEAHKVLGVAKDASEEQVRKAYKILAMKWHPDRRPEDTDDATAKFVEIHKASKSLLQNLRRKYGSSHTTTPAPAPVPVPPPAPAPAPAPNVESPVSSPQSSPQSRTSPLPKSHSYDSNSSGSQSSVQSDATQPSFASFTCSDTSSSPSLSATNSATPGRPICRSHSTSASSFLQPGPLPTEDPAGSGPSDQPTCAPSRLKKQSRPPSMRSNRDFTPLKSSPHRNANPGDPECTVCVVETLRPGRAILSGAGGDSPKKWVHVLHMTLEELFHGKVFHFRILRYTRVGKKKIVPVDIHIPAGTRTGTEILIQNIGHERKDGTRQDVAFLVKEKDHPRFTRVHDDLLMEVRLPWLDSLSTAPGNVYLRSVDDQDYQFSIDYCTDQLLSGTTVLSDAGMPRRNGVGRGKIIVRWEISPPSTSSWDALKMTLGFKSRGA